MPRAVETAARGFVGEKRRNVMSKSLGLPRLAAFALAIISAAPASAHDFWMEASPWFAAPGASVAPELHVGHAADHASWGGGPDRIVSFRSISAAGAEDRRQGLVFDPSKKSWTGAVKLAEPGVHVLALETNDAVSVLPAEKFDAYVAEEGLTPAQRARAASKDAPGRERYSRRAKALVFVEGGDREALPPLAGHTLEIAPLDSPFSLAQDEALRLRVYFQGKPLPGASVKLESLSVGLLPTQRLVTDGSGKVAFALPKHGAWKASVVWTTPLRDDPKADFETIFASLAFSFDEDAEVSIR